MIRSTSVVLALSLSVGSAAQISVTLIPPVQQPAPVAIDWAPPPMLDQAPGDPPFADAIWVGGYWTWEGDWVWARGSWVAPPQPDFYFQPPYYENRGGTVIFVGGFWCARGSVFVPPPPGVFIARAPIAAGVIPGPRLTGPVGVFVPPPPGSHPGIIVPAPLGTHPSVVVHAPPVVREGMVIRAGGNGRAVVSAPAGVTVHGEAVHSEVALRPRVSAPAPGHANMPMRQNVAPHPRVAPMAPPAVRRPPPRPMTPPARPMNEPHPMGGGHHR